MNFEDLDGKLNNVEEKLIIIIFSLVIISGIFGNCLVIWTILFNRQMRTSNNVIIFNLALSDLTLCCFSIPLCLYKTLRHTWIFGDFLCRLSPFFQASNVFVSSMSITAIALDRYIHIVCAMRIRKSNTKSTSLRTYMSIVICVFIWLFAFLLSSPLFVYNTTTHMSVSLDEPSLQTQESYQNDHSDHSKTPLTSFVTTLNSTVPLFSKSSDANNTQSIEFDENVYTIHHCVENWRSSETRMIYSYSSLLIQYILPIIIFGLAYGSIWWKLKKHRKNLRKHTIQLNHQVEQNTHTNTHNHDNINVNDNKDHAIKQIQSNLLIVADTTSKKKLNTNTENKKKQKKMNILLMSIAVIFALSWLPLNIFNILSDLKLNMIKADHTYYLVNAACICLGMSSAVSNPFMYGFLNENFKREYSRLFNKLFKKFCFKKEKKNEIVDEDVPLKDRRSSVVRREDKEIKESFLL